MGCVRFVRSAEGGGFGPDTGEPRRFRLLAIITGKVVYGWDRCVDHPKIVANAFSRAMGAPPASACRSLIDRISGLYEDRSEATVSRGEVKHNPPDRRQCTAEPPSVLIDALLKPCQWPRCRKGRNDLKKTTIIEKTFDRRLPNTTQCNKFALRSFSQKCRYELAGKETMNGFSVSVLSVLIILYGSVALGWAAEPIPVFVSIAPQSYFVQQIGKELVDVHVLVEPGADPHTYEPKPQQMVALSKAALYFAIGIEFETAKLAKITAVNPRMQMVHTDHGVMKLPMDAHGHHNMKDKREEDHHQGSLDPHIWLSPPLVMLQARSILTALQAVDPAHRSTYEANYRAFILDVVDLDAQLRAIFDGLKGSPFMVFHPSWGTFAHTYGLNQVPIEIEGKSPKPAQLKELIERARSNRIKIIFVQPQFSSKSAEQISKAIGGRVAVVDPLAQDWANNLRRVAEEFKNAFK